MKKEEFINKLIDYGDAIVTYRSEQSKKLKYNVVTLDFSNPHIKTKKTHAKENNNTVLTFSWDTDAYRLINVPLVTSVVPLEKVLKNVR